MSASGGNIYCCKQIEREGGKGRNTQSVSQSVSEFIGGEKKRDRFHCGHFRSTLQADKESTVD